MKLPEKPINWMNMLEKEGEKVFRYIQKENLFTKAVEFNKRYLYYDELKYRTKNETEQKYLWTFMKLLRSERYEEIPFKPLNIKYIHLPEITKYLHKFDKFLAGNISIQTKRLGLEERYIISSLMEEAIASSILEGAMTTRKVAKEMLKTRRKPRDKNEQMVANGYETMQMIVKRKEEKLTPEFLLEIQAMITKNTLDNPKHVGSFRETNDVVVGDHQNIEITYHIPPDYKKVPSLVKQLCDFANNEDDEFIHPMIKGIILHFLIGFIHPFYDGNGRTARSVFYWYLLSRGYWLFEYLAVSRRILRSKNKYGLAYLYTELDEFDTTYFLKYNLEAIEDALNDLLEYIKLKQKEQKEALKLVESLKNLNYRQATILKEAMQNPNKWFSIKEIAETYNVVYQTARTDLLHLAEEGYLIKTKISKQFYFKYNTKRKAAIKS